MMWRRCMMIGNNWVMKGKIVSDQSHSLSFELSVVKVDSKIFNGGFLALKSSLKSYLISVESLHVSRQWSNSWDVKLIFLSQSVTLSSLAGELICQIIDACSKIRAICLTDGQVILEIEVGSFLGFNGGKMGSYGISESLDFSFTSLNHISLSKSFSLKLII